MATFIYFAAATSDRMQGVWVEESPEQVHESWIGAGRDQPFPATSDQGERVYINPRTVAYWEPV